MVYEIFRYRVEPDRVEAFLRACREAERDLRESSHCLSCELTRSSAAPEDFVLTIEWDSLETGRPGSERMRELHSSLESVEPFSADSFDGRSYSRVPLEGASRG